MTSNQKAIELAHTFSNTFCIPITKTGILNSLVENLPSLFKAEINLKKIPLLDGFLELESRVAPNPYLKQNKNLLPQVKTKKKLFI